MSNVLKKVSVLVPIFGVELYIERCVRSLLEQTFDGIEYIFVDDCTEDSSIDILKQVVTEYPNRRKSIKILRHEVNRGLAAARNTALSAATGYYIMHVDSDDYIEPNAIQLLYNVANDSGAEIVVCDNKFVYKDKILTSKQYIPKEKEEFIKLLLTKKAQPSIWGKLIVRDVYIRSGVRAVEGLNYGEDYAVIPRLVYYANNVVKLDKPLYNYVLYNNAAYTKNISISSITDMIWANKILDDFFSFIPERKKYENALVLSKLRTQIYLLRFSDVQLWEHVINLYPEQKSKYYLLSFSDRILLNLARKKWYTSLKITIRCGFWFKRFIIKLKFGLY